MKRDQFFSRAKKHGWERGKRMAEKGRTGLKNEMLEYLNSPEGKEALGRAPSWLREKTPEDIAELLMSEVDDGGQKHTPAT